ANGNAIFEMSKNDVLLAYCRGNNSVSIYLVENTLEIATKLFKDLYRINSIDFVHDDEKLFLIGEEERDKGDGSTELVAVIKIWDLFSSSEDAVKTIKDTQDIISGCKYNASMKIRDHYHRYSSASGTIVGVNEYTGEVFSIVDHPNLANFLKPPILLSKLVKLGITLDAPSPSIQIYHYIYTLDGKFLDAKQEKKVIVISNGEPWHRYKQHPRISAYLNDDKTLQVIMGLTTIQVWRKNEKSKFKRRLVYIWANLRDDRFEIQRLLIGNGEFFVELLLPDTKDKERVEIHWPQNCSALRSACSAIEYLNKQRNEPVTFKKKQLFHDLVRQTKNILKRFIKTHPNVWRMTDARYEIMQSLIRGQCVSLIKTILFKKDDKHPRGISSK
ncbi:2441_t:CDS:1, partial [Scutellospora calospora]